MARPQPAADLLSTFGLPVHGGLARLVGCAEAVIGMVALTVGGPAAAGAVALLYTAFAMVVVRALLVNVPSCGCFGNADTPPSRIHLVGNLCLAGLAGAVAAAGKSPTGMVVDMGRSEPAAAIALVLAVGVLAGLMLVAFTALPEALQMRSAAGSTTEAFRIEPGSLRRHEPRLAGDGLRR